MTHDEHHDFSAEQQRELIIHFKDVFLKKKPCPEMRRDGLKAQLFQTNLHSLAPYDIKTFCESALSVMQEEERMYRETTLMGFEINLSGYEQSVSTDLPKGGSQASGVEGKTSSTSSRQGGVQPNPNPNSNPNHPHKPRCRLCHNDPNA